MVEKSVEYGICQKIVYVGIKWKMRSLIKIESLGKITNFLPYSDSALRLFHHAHACTKMVYSLISAYRTAMITPFWCQRVYSSRRMCMRKKFKEYYVCYYKERTMFVSSS